MNGKYWLIAYIAFFTVVFASGHLIIGHAEPLYRQINMLAVLTVLSSYALFIGLTPLFYYLSIAISYAKGFLWMCASMLVAGLFIWAVFGDRDYASDFYEYEFVTAGLWFGFVNLVCMFVIGRMRRKRIT